MPRKPTQLNEMENTLCTHIKKYSKEKKIGAQEIADYLGVSFQSVSHYFRGVSIPSVYQVAQLAKLFNVSIYDLIGEEK